MSERLKEADCKSVGYAYVGSNPTPSTTDCINGLFVLRGIRLIIASVVDVIW